MEHVYKIKRILTNQELKKKKIMKIQKVQLQLHLINSEFHLARCYF